MTNDKRAIWGWAIYDWANSAFATTVMAGFFPLFFKQYWSHGADVNLSTAQLGFGNALAGLLVALMAPLLGAVADRGGAKKKFLIGFAYLGVLASGGLFFVAKGQWVLAILVYVIGVIGFSGANIFYDALLPSLAGEARVDRVSSLGFSLGYLGGGLLFLINVLMTLMPARFGLPDAAAAVRLSFLTVALWWGAFTLITLFWVPEPAPGRAQRSSSALRDGLHQLLETLRRARHLKTVSLFLLAYWFYIDGVDTIIRMAVDYGMSLGFAANDLIVALLLVQFVGFPAALVFGRLGERWGVRRAIYLAIGVYIGVTIWGTMMRERHEFYILAFVIGLVQGGIQALSRSYYTRIIPRDKAAEFFGFYNMLGKFATIIGPALMGTVGLVVRRLMMPANPGAAEIQAVGQLATRWSLGSVVLLFLIGLVLFSFVDEARGRAEAARLAD
jgi:UMF1 family MFS transporter